MIDRLRILTDTSILLRLHHVNDVQYTVCTQALERLADHGYEVCVCAQVFIEYWAVATRPAAANGLGLDPAEAEVDLRELERTLGWLPEPSDVGAVWREFVNRYAVRGRQVHDTRLVALIHAHGVTELLTLNPDDFRRYTEIRCRTPADVMGELP